MLIDIEHCSEEDCREEARWLEAHAEDIPLPLQRFCAMHYPNAYVRRACLRAIGVEFADDSSFVNAGFTVVPNAPSDVHVRIGRNVSIAPNVTCICDSSANNGRELNAYEYVREQLTRKAHIIIDDESWIGANVTILPGVTISRFCVVGAGAVVTKSTEEFGIYAGVPAAKIGDVRCWEDAQEA